MCRRLTKPLLRTKWIINICQHSTKIRKEKKHSSKTLQQQQYLNCKLIGSVMAYEILTNYVFPIRPIAIQYMKFRLTSTKSHLQFLFFAKQIADKIRRLLLNQTLQLIGNAYMDLFSYVSYLVVTSHRSEAPIYLFFFKK